MVFNFVRLGEVIVIVLIIVVKFFATMFTDSCCPLEINLKVFGWNCTHVLVYFVSCRFRLLSFTF